VESSGNSNTKDVLRSAAWMTKTTSAYEKTLEKVGISVGAYNSSGRYSDYLSSILPSNIDKKE
jgi:hypothetical protein